MTHYRLTLALGEGAAVRIVGEAHKRTPRLEQGWGRAMKARGGWGISVRIRLCPVSDELCEPYQEWLKALDEHEDDIEAEALRNEAKTGSSADPGGPTP